MNLPPLDRPIYIYLTDPAWAEAWVSGGRIPLFPCSKYKSDFRAVNLTPDEVEQRSFSGFSSKTGEVDLFAEQFAHQIARTSGFKNVSFIGNGIQYDDGINQGPLSGSVWIE